ncbi:hypothetical protein P171DRAFT_99653 [Karstenula rhodostoma CBS 690.94]|uniref:Uncharacterized protein n=1 Tax=Karstenula rhodostoma CBS 690.94 TaxID=1392251 RepID=A0A9P4U7P9_9PLEO|nr:hypothetical protein P171DRAFT_99653 [Karstenula rhodostoma CBS 690.94]
MSRSPTYQSCLSPKTPLHPASRAKAERKRGRRDVTAHAMHRVRYLLGMVVSARLATGNELGGWCGGYEGREGHEGAAGRRDIVAGLDWIGLDWGVVLYWCNRVELAELLSPGGLVMATVDIALGNCRRSDVLALTQTLVSERGEERSALASRDCPAL